MLTFPTLTHLKNLVVCVYVYVCVCVCVRVCVCAHYGSGMLEGGTRLVTWTFVLIVLCTEAGTVGEQQLKWMQSESSS